jgi:hypothetical protein
MLRMRIFFLLLLRILFYFVNFALVVNIFLALYCDFLKKKKIFIKKKVLTKPNTYARLSN